MAALNEMIQGVLEGTSEQYTGSSLIISNHLQQMRLFGIRQGIELLPAQDDPGKSRKAFIDNLWDNNQLDLYLDRIWDLTLAQGQILLYLRPLKSGSYRIDFFSKNQFRAYYDGDGNLDEVIIIYSYKERKQNTLYHDGQKKYIKIVIRKDKITHTRSESVMGFEEANALPSYSSDIKTYDNELGFISCVVVKNNPKSPGRNGSTEFEPLASQLEDYDDMVKAMTENLLFFGNPSLISTRPEKEIKDALTEEDAASHYKWRPVTSQGGWYSADGGQVSTDVQHGSSGRSRSHMRVKKVIGNVQPDERFGYIAPDPMSPDHYRHMKEQREALHFALGGIDELGINASATAYEMKSVYGKVSSTSEKKAKSIYDNGLCRLFEMAIYIEEQNWKKSVEIYMAQIPKSKQENEYKKLMERVEQGDIPEGIFGLPPFGDRTIRWRYRGDIFEDSPRDRLDKSIVSRNLQELGVRRKEALKTVFNDKTEDELKDMLEGGYPFRYITSINGALQQLLGMYSNMLSLPHPDNPDVPLAFTVPINPLIRHTVDTLFRELETTRPEFEEANAEDVPFTTGVSNINEYLNGLLEQLGSGATPTTGASVQSNTPTAIQPFYLREQSDGGSGVSPTSPTSRILGSSARPPQFTSELPRAGSTVGVREPASTSQYATGSTSATSSGGVPSSNATTGSSARTASLISTLFPNLLSATKRKPGRPKRSRSK